MSSCISPSPSKTLRGRMFPVSDTWGILKEAGDAVDERLIREGYIRKMGDDDFAAVKELGAESDGVVVRAGGLIALKKADGKYL